jgi:hypothetical protein
MAIRRILHLPTTVRQVDLDGDDAHVRKMGSFDKKGRSERAFAQYG